MFYPFFPIHSPGPKTLQARGFPLYQSSFHSCHDLMPRGIDFSAFSKYRTISNFYLSSLDLLYYFLLPYFTYHSLILPFYQAIFFAFFSAQILPYYFLNKISTRFLTIVSRHFALNTKTAKIPNQSEKPKQFNSRKGVNQIKMSGNVRNQRGMISEQFFCRKNGYASEVIYN